MFDGFVRAPRLLAVLLLTAVAACGESDEAGGAACNMAPLICAEYGAGVDLSQAQSACTAREGTWQASCPAANRLGTCIVTSPIAVSIHAYLGRYGSAADAASSCTIPGATWTAGPEIPQGAATQQTLFCDLRSVHVGGLVVNAADAVCESFSGEFTPERSAALRELCAAQRGTLLADGCPAATAGSCERSTSALVFVTRHYTPAAQDEAACIENGGTWTP